MPQFIFLWSTRNIEHIGKHAVTPDEAAYVVDHAVSPFPRGTGDNKQSVWGRTAEGRFLQVIFVPTAVEDVEFEEYEQLQLHEQLALAAGDPAIRIIHARELTNAEKRALRKRRRGQ